MLIYGSYNYNRPNVLLDKKFNHTFISLTRQGGLRKMGYFYMSTYWL